MNLRDKYFSHFDIDAFKDMKVFFEKNEIKDSEIEGSFYLIESTIRKYLYLCNKSVPSYELVKNWKVTIDMDFLKFIS